MQIEKHIKIVPTPTGAVVFFAGQVCLNITKFNEDIDKYVWNISPVFAKLTTGASTFVDVPRSWVAHETLAEAIADGLTRLDEMQAFYGVIDMPEDTYVEEHLDEGAVPDYSGIHADVKRTGKTHEQLASEHRAYAKQMRSIGKDGLAVRSEMLADSHDKYIASLKKTNESVEDEDLLVESFVVRQVGQSRNYPSRIMISAAAVINRAREMAKEAGEKSHAKFIKLAHADIASNMKAESEEIEGDQIEEGFNDTDTVFLTPQTGPMAHMRYNTFKEGSASDHKKAIKYHSKDADRADPKMARFHDMRAKMHTDYLSGKNEEFVQDEDDQIEEGLVDNIKRGVKNIKRGLQGWGTLPNTDLDGKNGGPKGIIKRNKEYDDETVKFLHHSRVANNGKKHSPAALQQRVLDREMKKRGLTKEEFVQYEDALPDVFQLIKEDCRIEALAMSDSLVEAQQLANELFEDIVEEYLNGLFEATHQDLLDGAQKAYVEATRKGNGVMAKHYGTEILKHKANIAAIAARAKKSKLKEEVEEVDEGKILDAEAKIKAHDANKTADMSPADLFSHENIRKQLLVKRKAAQRDYNKRLNNEEVESIDEVKPLQGDAYWKAKEAESKEEFLKSQRKALGLPEPVKRGRGKPTLIDRDLLKSRAHSNVEAGKRPTAGFDRNEKIHFVRHLKDHPDFADKHVSQAGRPTGTTKVAKQQQELVKKKQDTAFSMWAGLGKR